MIVVKNKIIAFREAGEMLIFDSRAEFGVTDKKEERLTIIFATPSDLYRRLVDLEVVEETVVKEDDWRISPQWKEEVESLSDEELQAEATTDKEADEKDFEKEVQDAVEEGEFSEATIKRIREREEDRWKKIKEVEA